MKSKSLKSQYIRYIDYLWGTIIVLKDRHCQLCYRNARLEPHHFFTRKMHSNVRWDTRNGILLCHGCHQWKAQSHSEQIRDILIKRIGEEEFEALKARAYMTVKPDLRMWELQLLHELQDYVKMHDDWLKMSYNKRVEWLREVRRNASIN